MARTGFIGFNWTTSPIRAIGFVGFNFNHPNYLIIKVREKKDSPAPLDGIIVSVSANGGTTQYVTDVDGYVYISNRDFETATISAISNNIETVKIYDSSIQTNQFIEIILDADPCLSLNPFNRSTFIRFQSTIDLFMENDQVVFFDELDQPQPFTGFCDGCAGEQDELLPNNYERNNKLYYPKLILTQTFSLIVNGNLFNFGVSNYRLDIINSSGAVVQSGVNFESGTNSNNETTVLIEDKLTGGEENRNVRFAFIETTTGSVSYISSEFEVRFSTQGLVKLQYRNSSDIFNFNYTVWPDKYNIVYLNLNRLESQGEYEIKQYQEQTTGKLRTQRSLTKKYIVLEAFYFDEYAHEAMRALSSHDDILMNDIQMEIKEQYNVAANQWNSVQKGTIQFYDQRFSTINLNG